MEYNLFFIIGIAGASGSGKTYLMEKLKNKIKESYFKYVNSNIDIETISCDNYYYENDTLNKDLPSALELSLLAEHIIKLKKGETVEIPEYNFITQKRVYNKNKIIDGSKIKVLIVEGLFVLYDENIRNLLNLKLFTYLDEDITLARRIDRDTHQRNKTFTKIIHEYQSYVKPAFISIIKPSMIHADMIISTSDNTDDTVYLDVICQYTKCKL
jgi:uridine kinase